MHDKYCEKGQQSKQRLNGEFFVACVSRVAGIAGEFKHISIMYRLTNHE
jgi:hypothetical protein